MRRMLENIRSIQSIGLCGGQRGLTGRISRAETSSEGRNSPGQRVEECTNEATANGIKILLNKHMRQSRREETKPILRYDRIGSFTYAWRSEAIRPDAPGFLVVLARSIEAKQGELSDVGSTVIEPVLAASMRCAVWNFGWRGLCREPVPGRLIDTRAMHRDHDETESKPEVASRRGVFLTVVAFQSLEPTLNLRPRDLLSREIDFGPLWRALRDHPVGLVLALGVIARVWVYLTNRSYWFDEGSILGNLIGTSIFDFSGPLVGDQLAPFGFLVIQRVMVGLLGDSGYATRFVPL